MRQHGPHIAKILARQALAEAQHLHERTGSWASTSPAPSAGTRRGSSRAPSRSRAWATFSFAHGRQGVDQRVGRRRPGLVVAREPAQDGRRPGPVLHDLRRRLDEVELVPALARGGALSPLEAEFQDMAELVEQPGNVIVNHQDGTVSGRSAEVEDERQDGRSPGSPGWFRGQDERREPAAGPLAVADEQVQVDVGKVLAGVRVIEGDDDHVPVPDRHVRKASDGDAEDVPQDREQAIEHGVEREVVRERREVQAEIAALAGVVERPVPELERAVESVCRSCSSALACSRLASSLRGGMRSSRNAMTWARPPDIRDSFANWLARVAARDRSRAPAGRDESTRTSALAAAARE